MKEIAKRLHENRQIQLAKEILESAGYTVTKMDESLDWKFRTGHGEVSRYESVVGNLVFGIYDLEVLEGREGFIVDCWDNDKADQKWIEELCGETYQSLDAAKKAVEDYVSKDINESSDDLVAKVKKALDDADIKYEVIGKNKDRLVVSKADLRRASEIRDEIDPEYTVTVSSRA